MAEHPALVAAGRWGLTDPAGPVSLPDDDLDAVLRVAMVDRLAGLLSMAISDGAVLATDEVAARVRELWHEQLLASVVVEAQAVRAAEVLDTAGVRWRLTKGAAVAHLDYPEPALRPFGDVDVLVHPDSWDGALRACADAGWVREAPELRPGYDHRFGKGATLDTPEGLEVDLHRRFAVGRFGVRSDMSDVFDGQDAIRLAGRALTTLDGPGRLLHACHHATLGGFRHLRAHRDVAQLLLASAVDWERTLQVARGWRAEAVMARAITETWDRLDLDLPHPAWQWACDFPMSRADAKALEVFGRERPFREQAMTALSAVRWRDLPSFAFTHASPEAVRRYARSRRRR